MKLLLAVLVAVHGLIHFMGFAKAFGYAELPALTQPISRPLGLVWLGAALALLATAVTLLAAPKWAWVLGIVGLVASQVAIGTSWADARFGTIGNLFVLGAAAYAFAWRGPTSFRAHFARDVRQGLEGTEADPPAVTEADLAHLPSAVARYLRRANVVGNPRVANYRLRFSGRLRQGPDSRWMKITADQQSFADRPARFFLIDATSRGIPFEAIHRYVGAEATMRVKVASLIPVAAVAGAEMSRSETVTLFNDMCLWAPATLIDRKIAWKELDPRSVEARFTNGNHTITAVLTFDEAGDLVDFVSDDRAISSPDGKTFTSARWETPVGDYRQFGSVRLAARGEARWQTPHGSYAYAQLDLMSVDYNVR